MRRTALRALLGLLCSAASLHAQNGERSGGGAAAVDSARALRVFVDCSDVACDLDYLQTNVSFVSYVRDRRDAQVHVLITTQETADRGKAFTMLFMGNGEFKDVDDSLGYTAASTDSQDRRRSELANVLKRGLVRYVNRTPLGDRLVVSYVAPVARPAAERAGNDKWDLWSFATTISGFFDGEESSRGASFSGAFSANRVSDRWKIETSAQTRYASSRLDVEGAGTFKTIQRNHAFNGLLVRSVNGHWSAGGRATVTSSTFLNQRLTARLAPAVEYNVFPYGEATRRQITFQYSLGATSAAYIEETIFERTSETLLDERLLASVQLRQPWGSISAGLEGSHYLHDPSRKRGIAATNVDVNVARGLSLVTFGGLELVRDQLFLAKRGASTDEVLLRQRQLATSFRFWMSLGLSYSFGSKFANIVNPRFRGSSAGTMISQ